MGIGICCQWLERRSVIKKNGETKQTIDNIIGERTLQLGRYEAGAYSSEFILETYINNIREVSRVLDIIYNTSKIRHFRLSSNLIPLMDKVERSLWDNDTVRNELLILGKKISELQFRVSTHPGQFTVLSSDRDDVIANSISELENQGWLFDAMGLERSVQFPINIHGGKSGRPERLIASILKLSPGVKSRLTLENDESAYSVKELLPVSNTGVPIVFDSHHHTFRPDGMSGREAAEAAMATWPPWIIPIQHLSNTEPEFILGSFAQRRQHSYALHYIPDFQLEMINCGLVDVEMEFKGKNDGVLPHLSRLGIKYDEKSATSELATPELRNEDGFRGASYDF